MPLACTGCARAGTQLALEAYVEEMASIDIALQMQPHLAEGFALRGHVLSKLDRTDDAIGSYRQALQLDPDTPTREERLCMKNL
jgi:cytochrome c-type biogenesis protein CcmH/NrfG